MSDPAITAELLRVLKSFVTEHRAYQSPECEECPIIGPLLKEADAIITRAESGE